MTRRALLRLAGASLGLAAAGVGASRGRPAAGAPVPAVGRTVASRWIDDAAPYRVAGKDGAAQAVHRAGHDFTAVGAFWEGSAPPLEIRVSADGASWSDWLPIALDECRARTAAGTTYADLRPVSASRYLQYRWRPGAGAASTDAGRPGRLGFELIDARDGPDPDAEVVAPAGGGGSAVAAVGRPRIISRAEWGANEQLRFDPDSGVERWPVEIRAAQKAAVHHTATGNFEANPGATVRAIYYYHAVTQGWGDIGYNFLVDWKGNIYEGRYGGLNVVGGHLLGYNPGNVGVGCLGTFVGVDPPAAMVDAIVRVLAWRCQYLDVNARTYFVDEVLPTIMGHRDAMTTGCPGDRLYAQLGAIRSRVAAAIGPLPQPDAQITAVSLAPAALFSGGALRVRVTVRNGGTGTLLTQGPEPGFVYAEGESFASRGFAERPGAWRVGVDFAANWSGRDYPYRWGLPDALEPGQSATVEGYVRLASPRATSYWTGAVQESVRWATQNAGTTDVVVRAPAHRLVLPAAPRGS